MSQHKASYPIQGLTSTAPSTTNSASASKPVVVVESYYDATTKRWYRKYSDGWIEQGGYYDNGSGMTNYQQLTVTFGSDYNFTEAPLMVHCMQYSTGDTGSGYAGLYGVSDVSATGFTYCVGYTGNGNSTGFYWTAKGI